MPLLNRKRRRTTEADRRALQRVYWGGAVLAAVIGAGGFAWLEFRGRSGQPDAAALKASPSEALTDALAAPPIPFDRAVVESIRDHGLITVTVHVVLADRKLSKLAPVDDRFGDGDDPSRNQYWGALFGVETYLLNRAGWQRAFTDAGDGEKILRRVVFHRSVEPGVAWQRRGVTEPFEIYVLANAWRSSRISDAMEQPLRDALGGAPVTLAVEGRSLDFGGASVMVGYIGQNAMMAGYWDPFVGLPNRPGRVQVGVFYACWKSAIYFHRGIVERGLYPVLFVRQEVVPEAYLLDGLLGGLILGEFDDGFLASAASEYAKHQSGVSFDRAHAMLFR